MKLQTNIENIKANPEAFGKALCDALGLRVTQCEGVAFYSLSKNKNGVLESCDNLALDLQLVSEIEKAVKVGNGRIYAEQLVKVIKGWECCEPLFLETVAEIATASAQQRICAMLLALGIDEIEVKGNVS